MKAKLSGVLLDTAVYYAVQSDSGFFYTSPDRKSIPRIYQGSQGALYKGVKI